MAFDEKVPIRAIERPPGAVANTVETMVTIGDDEVGPGGPSWRPALRPPDTGDPAVRSEQELGAGGCLILDHHRFGRLGWLLHRDRFARCLPRIGRGSLVSGVLSNGGPDQTVGWAITTVSAGGRDNRRQAHEQGQNKGTRQLFSHRHSLQQSDAPV